MNWEQVLFLVVGAFTLFIGITKTFFNHRKAQRLIRLVGEAGAQIIYIILGIVFIVLSFIIF